MGIADNYEAQAAQYLGKAVLTSVEREKLEDIFYNCKVESESIFPDLYLGNPSSEEEARCFLLLEQMGDKGGII
jgi:hypothetical protein